MALTDFRFQIIPNALVSIVAVAGLLSTYFAGSPSLMESVGGAILSGGYLYLLSATSQKLAQKPGMGGGDIKLAAACGLFLGPIGSFVGIFIASLLALGWWLGLRLFSRSRVSHAVAFGPFLVAGTLIAKLFGAQQWLGLPSQFL